MSQAHSQLSRQDSSRSPNFEIVLRELLNPIKVSFKPVQSNEGHTGMYHYRWSRDTGDVEGYLLISVHIVDVNWIQATLRR